MGTTTTTEKKNNNKKKNGEAEKEEDSDGKNNDDDDENNKSNNHQHRDDPIKISNLDDLNALKRAYEEMFCEGLLNTGRVKERHTFSNVKILIGVIACTFAVVAQLYPYLKREEMKFSQPFIRKLTLACVIGYVLSNLVLTVFVLKIERGVLLWGEIDDDSDDDEAKERDEKTKKRTKKKGGEENKRVDMCARIHHVRYSSHITLELVSRSVLKEKLIKTKTKKGEIVLPQSTGRVSKVFSVGEYIYTDGTFAETAFLKVVENLLGEYEVSFDFSNGKKYK